MKHITDALSSRCLCYWEALRERKTCLYQCNTDDLDVLIVAMSLGAFKVGGTAIMTDGMRALKQSKERKTRPTLTFEKTSTTKKPLHRIYRHG
jgi:hypothetical protein